MKRRGFPKVLGIATLSLSLYGHPSFAENPREDLKPTSSNLIRNNLNYPNSEGPLDKIRDLITRPGTYDPFRKNKFEGFRFNPLTDMRGQENYLKDSRDPHIENPFAKLLKKLERLEDFTRYDMDLSPSSRLTFGTTGISEYNLRNSIPLGIRFHRQGESYKTDMVLSPLMVEDGPGVGIGFKIEF